MLYVSRLRLRVSHRDPSLVVAQGATRRSYKPFAQCFGASNNSEAKAVLIVKSVNCHNHLVKAMQAVQRTSMAPVNGSGSLLRKRLSLISRYAAAALSMVNE